MSGFSKDFLFGASTASYQVEGGIENCDWAEAGRRRLVPEAGRACDHHNRYEEDFDIAKELGHNAHRISIEWARIEPEEGKFDEGEVEHYRKVLRALKARGITPFVTLWHFTQPLWFSREGGFERRNGPDKFARYCQFVVSRLADEADFWMTINEPMVFATNGYIRRNWPPFKRNPFKYLIVIDRLACAHRKAYKAIKKIKPSLQVGIAKNNIFFESNLNPINKIIAFKMRWFWNRRFLRKIRGYQDFIGLNHYFRYGFGIPSRSNVRSDMGWEVYPKALYECLVELKKYRLPIYVTENGIADSRDDRRPDFIRESVRCMRRAIEEGVPVRGYLYWSLLDNFEWAEGFEKRFGLVEINYDTMKRTPRPSAYLYKEIIDTWLSG